MQVQVHAKTEKIKQKWSLYLKYFLRYGRLKIHRHDETDKMKYFPTLKVSNAATNHCMALNLSK